MIGLLILALGLVGQWLLGIFVAAKILSSQNRSPIPLAEFAGLGCVLGISITAWALFLWSFFGGPLGPIPSVSLAILGYILGGPILLRALRLHNAEPLPKTPDSLEQKQERAISLACQALIACLFMACLLQTLQTPQKLWDERAIFAIKAKVLFEGRSIHSPTLRHPDFVQYHPRYPLLLPLAEEHVYALLGYVDDRLSKLVFTLLYVGMVLTAAGVFRRHFSVGRAWLSAVLLASIPALMPYEYGFLAVKPMRPSPVFTGYRSCICGTR